MSDGFQSAMVHLYRGEMNRMTVWRQRLDVTSNWAMLLTLGLTTFTLGDAAVPHYVLLLGLALVAVSILIEGRRYRHLHHSAWRVWVLEAGFFADLLRPGGGLPGWREALAADLERPRLQVPWWCAIRARLRRNYLYLVYLITAVWLVKLAIHPDRPEGLGELYGRLAVGHVFPSWFVALSAPFFVLGATVIALTCPATEDLERFGPEDLRLPGG